MIPDTKRLHFRELRQSDFAALCRILQDEETMYAYNGAFDDGLVQDWLDRQIARYQRYGFGLWALIHKETGDLIGQFGLTMQPWKNRELLEIGYLLRRDCWHMGFATEAALACKAYAFDVLGADAVYSIIRDNNLPSQRVARRSGMQPIDNWTKHYRGVDMPHILFEVKRQSEYD